MDVKDLMHNYKLVKKIKAQEQERKKTYQPLKKNKSNV